MKRRFVTFLLCACLCIRLAFAAPGDLDTSFGTDGIVLTALSRADFINSCTVQPDDKIVVAGSVNGYHQRMGVARYTSNGALDTTFNGTGSNFFLIGMQAQAQSVTLQADNKILTTGYACESQTNTATVRLNTDGTFDTSFNSTGIVSTSIGYGAMASCVKVQPDTNIVIAGNEFSNQGNFALARYDASGALDSSFGTGGIVSTSIGYMASINYIALQADGKIIAAGYTWNGATGCCLARYNTDGTLDTSFGSSGIVTSGIGTESEINSVIIQDDGNIVAVGYAIDNDGVSKFLVARYDTNGDLDTTFNTTGFVLTSIQYEAKAASVILQPDGKIIVGGYSYADLATQFAVARYNTDGTLDTGFGVSGIALTTIGGHNSESRINSLCLQSNGDIIAAGYSNTTFAVARYLSA